MLNRDEVIPMYKQIAKFLQQQIIDGVYKEGDKISTELELIEQFNVSRTTIRLAVKQLIEMDLVEKWPGKGTFVKKGRILHPFNNFKSLYEILIDANITPETELLNFRKVVADNRVCHLLKIPPQSRVLEITRLYHSNNHPIVYSKVFIHPKYSDSVKLDEAKIHPVYQILEKKFDIKFKQVNFEVSAIIPPDVTAESLKIKDKVPVLGMERVLFDNKGEPAEYALSHFRADEYRFMIEVSNYDNTSPSSMSVLPVKINKE